MSFDYNKLEETLKVDFGYSASMFDGLRHSVVELAHTLDALGVVGRQAVEAAQVFARLIEDYSDSPVSEKSHEATWVPFVLGESRPGDIARVREGTYSGDPSWHNGLVGVITAVRGGRVLMQYKGRTDGIGHSHHPNSIEVLKK